MEPQLSFNMLLILYLKKGHKKVLNDIENKSLEFQFNEKCLQLCICCFHFRYSVQTKCYIIIDFRVILLVYLLPNSAIRIMDMTKHPLTYNYKYIVQKTCCSQLPTQKSVYQRHFWTPEWSSLFTNEDFRFTCVYRRSFQSLYIFIFLNNLSINNLFEKLKRLSNAEYIYIWYQN